MPKRSLAVIASALALSAASHLSAAQQPARPLERALADYTARDYAAVVRIFGRSLDFQHERLAERRRLARFVQGPWQRDKAAFLLELANQSSLVAPAYSIPLLTAGREYVLRRPEPFGSDPAADRFERLWHTAAVGILERRYLTTAIEGYIAAVRKSRPAGDSQLSARLLFGLAIAQEQRCWLSRPVLMRVGTPINVLNKAARAPLGADVRRSPAGVAPDVARRLDCLAEAADRFAAAAAASGNAPEPRIRLAWMRYQLGLFPEALDALEGADAGDDRDLRYWSALFRARVAGATGRPADAERDYRRALEIAPQAQSAGVGLALTLFEMNRVDDANAAARAVRAEGDALDPWWIYLAADSRFVDRWIEQLRARP